MTSHHVTEEEAGRTCPYCHTALEAGDKSHECESCGSLHHDDCWVEGGGCAVIGCTATVDDPDPEVRRRNPPDSSEEDRPERPSGEGGSRSKKALIGGGALAAAAAIALFLTISTDDEKTARNEGPATANSNSNKQPKSGKNKSGKQKQSKPKEKLTGVEAKRQLGLRFTRDPGGNWNAFLPSAGWSQPVDQGNQNTPEDPRYETTLNGPNGGFISIQTTPTVDPTIDPRNYAVEEVPYTPKRVPSGGMALGDLISFTNGADECSGIHCAKVLLSGGDGGGIAIIAGSQSKVITSTIVRQFAGQLDPGY